MQLMRQWALPLAIGVLVGTALAVVARSRELTMVFATVALVVAVHMTFVRHDWKLRDTVPRGVPGAFGVPIHRAVATASGFGLIISVPGTIGFIAAGWGNPLLPLPWYLGYVSLLGFVVLVPATLLAVPWGVALAHWLKPQPLRWAFAGFLALTSARMFWDLFG